jgi:hypothetical protein
LLKSRLQPSCARPFKIPLNSLKSSGYNLLQFSLILPYGIPCHHLSPLCLCQNMGQKLKVIFFLNC